MFNVISIQGRLTAKPEEKQAGSYKTARFSIAHQPTNKNKEVMYVNVVAWGKQCDFALKYLEKGSMVIVSGELDISTFTGRDGQKKTSVSINATSIDSIGGKADAEKYREEQTRQQENEDDEIQAWLNQQQTATIPTPTKPTPAQKMIDEIIDEDDDRSTISRPTWQPPTKTSDPMPYTVTIGDNPNPDVTIAFGPYAGQTFTAAYETDPDWVREFASRSPMTTQEQEQIEIAREIVLQHEEDFIK